MRRPCSALILFVLLGFALSLEVPAEDMPETPYDESETLPYEVTPLLSNVAPQASSRPADEELGCGYMLCFNSLTQRCRHTYESRPQSHCVHDSLTMVNRSLRC